MNRERNLLSRLKGLLLRGVDRGKDLFARFFAWLKEMLPRGFQMFQNNNMAVYAGYATLFIITSIFPFIILIISIVNLLPGYSAEDVASILSQILPNLEPIQDLLESLITELQDQSGGLLASAAAVTTLWSASKGVLAIQKGLNQLDITEQKSKSQKPENAEIVENGTIVEKSTIIENGKRFAKNILRRLIFTFTLVILIPALLVFETLGDSIAELICSILKKLNPDVLDSTLDNIDSFFHLGSLVAIALVLLVILQIYAKLPAVHRKLRTQLPGTILTGICWYLFTELFAYFIPRIYHASSLYGSLAAVFLLLLWLRYMVMILFAGGVLNRILEENKSNPQ